MSDAMPADVGFDFDPEPFKRGIDECERSVTGFEKHTQGAAAGIEKAMFWAMAKVQALGAAIKGLGNFIVGVVRQNIPELGQTFGIVKEIFFKNLFWPLRNQLTPVLQSILNWARDNRARFVEWGATLVNVFTAAWGIAKQLFTTLKALWDQTMAPLLKGFFKGGITDTINLMLAKIAVLGQFVSDLFIELFKPGGSLANSVGNLLSMVKDTFEWFGKLLSPNKQGDSILTVFKTIFETVGRLFEFITGIGADFLGGFLSKLAEMATPLQGFADAINKVFGILLSDKNVGAMRSFFRWLGEITGGALMTSLQILSGLLTGIAAAIEKIANVMQGKESIWSLVGGKPFDRSYDAYSRQYEATPEEFRTGPKMTPGQYAVAEGLPELRRSTPPGQKITENQINQEITILLGANPNDPEAVAKAINTSVGKEMRKSLVEILSKEGR